MSDDDRLELRPASAQEVEESLCFALRFAGRKRVHHADEVMARITAERLVQHLERSGYVLMKKPDAPPRAPAATATRTPTDQRVPDYVELQVTTNYSFLRGASRVEELLVQAKTLGMEAVAVADHNTLAGIARAHSRAAEVGLRLVVGCRLDLRDGLPLLPYPVDRAGYGRLCGLLTLGKGRAGKQGCHLSWSDVAAAAEGQLAILLPDAVNDALIAELRRLRAAFPGRCYLALTLRRRPGDWVRLRQLFDLAQAAQVPTVVTGEVLYHSPDRRVLQDVVTCIREGCPIDAAGHRLERYADRHLKSPAEMVRLFRDYPEAVARTVQIAERCTFSLDSGPARQRA